MRLRRVWAARSPSRSSTLRKRTRGFGLLSDLPETPGALEQRQVVELALLVLEHVVVLGERGLEVVVRVEHVLRQRHVGVGAEAALRVLREDPVKERRCAASFSPRSTSVKAFM